ncbi:MAG: 5-formyltetrahydrofolate cyclo-ligase [Bacteroides sp.]|nr:5-formyltetrahydrofolate cyclo-ligase [Bacteroides sp.]MCM1413434.1 5-formyltetrahydrofolate cyclo-ligase [Bacteroides sp.]MCM1471355.1 5-formyltetrahydrofolate cyclo-ligase [Bacteroides sp.]
MDKDRIRRRVKARKSLLNDNERLSSAAEVFKKLEALAAFAMSDRILIYNSLPDELSTREFIDRWKEKKHFYLPRVNGVDLDILPYDSSRTHLGAFHIEEPDGEDLTDPTMIEMVIVPGVAYDHNGNRVGRGKGYYDRLLRLTKALRIGVGYDFQIVDEISTEQHDVPVDIVITETNIYHRRR